MSYRLNPVEINVAEGGFADFKLCNDNGEQVVTFGFADQHEARIARALMIRAIKKAVLVVAHTTVARQNGDRGTQSHATQDLLLEFTRTTDGGGPHAAQDLLLEFMRITRG
jgi:hypothetical protein